MGEVVKPERHRATTAVKIVPPVFTPKWITPPSEAWTVQAVQILVFSSVLEGQSHCVGLLSQWRCLPRPVQLSCMLFVRASSVRAVSATKSADQFLVMSKRLMLSVVSKRLPVLTHLPLSLPLGGITKG